MDSMDNLDLEENMRLIIEEDEPESNIDNATLSQADIYYKFRYTFEENTGDLYNQMIEYKAVTKCLLSHLEKYMVEGRYVAGIEYFKSGMIDAKPHVHIHFVSRHKKDTIIKKLKRHSETKDLLLGNRCYSMGIEVNVNERKFWRYPLKQQKDKTKRFYCSNGIDDIDSLINEAYAVWITACEIQNKKIEKKEDSDLFSDRLFNYLNKQNVSSDISIKINIQKFYIDVEKKPFNMTTARGYFINYKVHKGLLSHEELAKLW